ncbi:MAG: hypothetical protein EHM28_00235 [Spirochaetaceae bacterium]|nr:MAG: hypothetical protein EHM28_00235 [Spirochaetaceae bacterium]
MKNHNAICCHVLLLAVSCMLTAVCILASGCLLSCQEQEIRIASYNVENLFDDKDDGTEYREYDPGLGKWNTSLYKLKLDSVIHAIQTIKPLPDILCLQEIENKNVLDALGRQLGYEYRALPSVSGIPGDECATTVGILSRHPVVRTASHQVAQVPQVAQLSDLDGKPVRDILEAEIILSDSPIVIFICHWKSKSEGAEITEPARQAAALTISNRVCNLLAARPALRIIIAGDLNESHDEYGKIQEAYQTALMPADGLTAPSINPAESLFLAASIEKSGLIGKRLFYFEPWYSITETGISGSYAYQKQWQALDHILLVGDFTSTGDLMFKNFFAHTAPELVWEESGLPRSWKTDSPFEGASDHLPVVAEFEIDRLVANHKNQ